MESLANDIRTITVWLLIIGGVVAISMGAMKKLVIYNDKNDIIITLSSVIITFLGLSLQDRSIFETELLNAAFDIVICNLIMLIGISLGLLSLRSSIKNNKSMATGVFIWIYKTLYACIAGILAFVQVRNIFNKDKSYHQVAFAAALLAALAYLTKLLINGREVFEKKGWAYEESKSIISELRDIPNDISSYAKENGAPKTALVTLMLALPVIGLYYLSSQSSGSGSVADQTVSDEISSDNALAGSNAAPELATNVAGESNAIDIQDLIQAERPYIEQKIGAQRSSYENSSEYSFNNCKIDITYENHQSTKVKVTLNDSCTVATWIVNKTVVITSNTTIGELSNNYNAIYYDCIKECGNSYDPEMYFGLGSSRASNFIYHLIATKAHEFPSELYATARPSEPGEIEYTWRDAVYNLNKLSKVSSVQIGIQI
jgi:hypothetical protein